MFPIALLRPTSRADAKPRAILDGVVTGIKNTLQIAMACACAGIVIGVIGFTGLGLEFTSLLRGLAQDSLLIALIVTAIAGIILGMGLPTTPAYIVQTALLVPALTRLGVVQEAAHLFVFYFAILSVITPPVAISLYAANSLSGARLWPAGAAALKLASTGYIVPFMFAFGPSLLLIGAPVDTVTASLSAIIGVVMLAAGLHGWLLQATPLWERGLLVAGALVLIHPDPMTDAAGAALLAIPLLRQSLTRRAALRAISQGRS